MAQPRKLLIIYPHWPPGNLAGVHRARLIANFLPQQGWMPFVLTVDSRYYEEKPDHDLCQTVAPHVQVRYVQARRVPRIRLFGDIALRAMPFLYREALQWIADEKFDFLWIPIPSFYTALLGRRLHRKTGIPYGIDYIDPWVNGFAGQDKPFSRAWLSNMAARILEPRAIKKAALITGVAQAYYKPAVERNFPKKQPVQAGMPYGFDPADHQIRLPGLRTPWADAGTRALVYAGAFLPKSHRFVQLLFATIADMKKTARWPQDMQLFFIGTGHYLGHTITAYAQDYGISDLVTEIPERYPFLHILNFLSNAWGILIIGSTEQHYTASKTFQALLSGRPVFSVFHHQSSAVQIMEQCSADAFTVRYNPQMSQVQLQDAIQEQFSAFIAQNPDLWHPELNALNQYAAQESARILAEKMEEALQTV